MRKRLNSNRLILIDPRYRDPPHAKGSGGLGSSSAKLGLGPIVGGSTAFPKPAVIEFLWQTSTRTSATRTASSRGRCRRPARAAAPPRCEARVYTTPPAE